MPPPPVTPSPHRFVIKKPAPIRKTPLAQEQTPQPSTQQFKATPRFTFSSTPRPTPSQNLPASTPSTRAPRFTTPAHDSKGNSGRIESIDSSFEELVQDSIETDEQEPEGDLSGDDHDDGHNTSQRSPKRRRLSSSPQLSSPQAENEHEDPNSLPLLSSPPAASRRPISSTPRFLLSTPAPASTQTQHQAQNTQQPFLKPPRFIPPDPTKQAQTEPLPEQFSPHRRGAKYMSGGLASEVRDWLLHLESAVPTSRPPPSSSHTTQGQRAKDGEEKWIVRIVIDSLTGGGRAGMTLIRGRQVHSSVNGEEEVVDSLGEVKVILAGEGGGRGVAGGLLRGGKVEVGKMVGIKGPVWEVVLEGVKWGVGVDWRVLS